MTIEINAKVILFDQETDTNLQRALNEAYLCIPKFLAHQLEDHFDREIDTDVPECVFNSNVKWAEYALKYPPIDERYPDLIRDLYEKGIPFYYQYEFTEELIQDIYFIPGKNNSQLTCVPPTLIFKNKRQWNKLIKGKINNSVLDHYVKHLQARLSLVADWMDLPNNWEESI